MKTLVFPQEHPIFPQKNPVLLENTPYFRNTTCNGHEINQHGMKWSRTCNESTHGMKWNQHVVSSFCDDKIIILLRLGASGGTEMCHRYGTCATDMAFFKHTGFYMGGTICVPQMHTICVAQIWNFSKIRGSIAEITHISATETYTSTKYTSIPAKEPNIRQSPPKSHVLAQRSPLFPQKNVCFRKRDV